jgi:hypothetical protein
MSKITPFLPRLAALICSAVFSLFTIPVLVQAQLPSGTQGEPLINENGGTTYETSGVWLDAYQFDMSSSDVCARINAAYTALPASGGVIDARAFNGLQPCNTNPFTGGTNIPVVLLLGAVQIVTSVQWWTPQAGGGIIGVSPAPGANTTGTVITACGPITSTAYSYTPSPTPTCTVNTTTVNGFPNGTTTLTFNYQHGPFSASSYPATFQCIICLGGQGTSEGEGWNHDGTNGMFVINVKVDLGGVANTFGIYSQNAEERSILDGDTFADWANSNASPDYDNNAAIFYDRTEAPTAQSGPTHFAFGNLSGNTKQTHASTSSYGLVYEGSNTTCVMGTVTGGSFPSNTPPTFPTCYVTQTNATSGKITGLALGYAGSGCSPSCTAMAWTVYGAPAAYGDTFNSMNYPQSCSGTATISGGAVTTLNFTSPCGSGSIPTYSPGPIGTGPESLHATFTGGSSSGTMTGGVLLDGMENAQVDYLHNEYNSGYALQLGTGNNYYESGFFKGIDVDSTVTPGGVVHLLPGGDTTQNFFNLQYTSGSGNMIFDESVGTGSSALTISSSQAVQSGSSKIIKFYTPSQFLPLEEISWNVSLGPISHLVGPTDQTFTFGTQNSQNMAFDPNGTGVVTGSSLATFADSVELTSATTITATSLTSTGLAMTKVPASTTITGSCHLGWSQSTAVSTVRFGIGASNAPTDLWVLPPAIWNGTTATYGSATTITSSTITAITSTITPAATGTEYKLDFDFTLETGSNPAIITIYGDTQNTNDALVVAAGSHCNWKP